MQDQSGIGMRAKISCSLVGIPDQFGWCLLRHKHQPFFRRSGREGGGGWVVANVARNGFPCERVVVGSAGRHGP